MCKAMVMPETFEEFIEMCSWNTLENKSKGESSIIDYSTVLKAWDYYKQKEYEQGCVKGYLNCISDHKYNPERLSIELAESESLKLERISEALNMGYPEVIKRAINMIYIMVGESNGNSK